MNPPCAPPGPFAPAPHGPPTGLTQEDESQLTLLSILFYVYAGFVGLTGLVFAGFALLPALLIPAAAARSAREGWIVGGIFLVVFGAVAFLLIAKGAFMVLAGRALARRSGWTMAMVGACVSLMNIPLGTALGIFALTVLQRPAVKARLSEGA